jgi:RND family efflux transporter MFP subunit
MHHKIKSAIGVIILAVIGVIIYNSTRPPKTTSARVTRQTIQEVVEASGRIKAGETVTLSFPAGSKIVWVGVKKGDQVKRWQTLASVDRRALEKSVKQKLLDYMTTRWNFEQTSDDHDVRGRSLEQVTLTDSEKRIVEKSQFGLDQAVLDYEIARLSLEQSTLITPIEGTVVDTSNLVAGQTLSTAELTGLPIKVTNMNSIYFQAEIDETDYSKIKAGLHTLLSLDSFPEATVGGTVRFIAKEGVKKTGGGVQIPVDISMNNTELPLIPELTGDVQIITNEKPNVLIVDKKYVTTKDGKSTVQVLTNGKLTTKEVTVGITSSKLVEITSGLNEGDEVVILSK